MGRYRLGAVDPGGRSLLAVEQAVLLEQDPAEARRIGREYIAFYLTLPNYLRAWERAGFGPEDLARRWQRLAGRRHDRVPSLRCQISCKPELGAEPVELGLVV